MREVKSPNAGAEISQIVGIIASLPGNLSWVPNVKTKPKVNKQTKTVKATLLVKASSSFGWVLSRRAS